VTSAWVFSFWTCAWNKAIFLWPLAGLLAALCRLLPEVSAFDDYQEREVRGMARFSSGRFPSSSITSGGRTPRSNRAPFRYGKRVPKFVHVRNAVGGNGLFGYIASEEFADNSKGAGFSPWARRALDSRTLRRTPAKTDWSTPSRWRCWPHPYVGARERPGFIGLSRGHMVSMAITRMPVRPSFTLSFYGPSHIVRRGDTWIPAAPLARGCLPVVVLVTMNLLVLSQYTLQFERDGADGPFTDAINPLSLARCTSNPVRQSHVLDWGIENVLEPVPPRPAASASRELALSCRTPSAIGTSVRFAAMLANPTPCSLPTFLRKEQFLGVGERFAKTIAAAGLTKIRSALSLTQNGRPCLRFSGLPRAMCR